MIGPMFAALVAVQAPANDVAADLCRNALAKKAGGEIATFNVKSSTMSRGNHIIAGQLTANIAMGPPQPGHASTHHLIRSDFTFRCRVSGGRVREARLNPLTN